MWPPTPPAAPPTRPPRPEGLASEGVVAVLTALFVTFRLITPARPPLAKPAPKSGGAAFSTTAIGIDMGGAAAASAAKMVTGEVLKAADALGRNHGLSQHTAAGVSYIDAQACHERVNFLRYFQKAYRAHEPDQDIAGNRLLAHSVHLGLHFFLEKWQRPAGRTGRRGLQSSARGTKFS